MRPAIDRAPPKVPIDAPVMVEMFTFLWCWCSFVASSSNCSMVRCLIGIQSTKSFVKFILNIRSCSVIWLIPSESFFSDPPPLLSCFTNLEWWCTAENKRYEISNDFQQYILNYRVILSIQHVPNRTFLLWSFAAFFMSLLYNVSIRIVVIGASLYCQFLHDN